MWHIFVCYLVWTKASPVQIILEFCSISKAQLKVNMLSLNSEKIITKRNFPGYLDQRLTDRADQISGVGADKLSTDTDKLSKDTDIGSVCVCVSHWISTVFIKDTVSKFPFVE